MVLVIYTRFVLCMLAERKESWGGPRGVPTTALGSVE